VTNGVALWRRLVRVIGFILLGFLISRAIYPIVWRSQWQPAIDALRWFNKKVQNPLTMRVAGRKNRDLAVLHHTGRRTGREYVVPVLAHRTGHSFMIPLSYGTEVDWLRNVLASGGCAIDHDGLRHDTVAPAIVPIAEAARNLSSRRMRVFGLLGIESFLRLDIVHSERPAEQAT
jgi:deazaflavin-dependent oxidoreductase (nitroreductase family)